MSTIFESVVRKENDHTNLLRNIMKRHPKVASTVMSYLIEREVSEVEAASLQFSTQHSFTTDSGREIPDILVEGHNFRCLIEAKVDPNLELTPEQKRGYQGCFPDEGDRHLCFLVPNEWKHRASIDEVRANVLSGIQVHRPSHWRGLIGELDPITEALADAVFNEALNFWKWRFQLETMTTQERDCLAKWSGEKYSAVRKLERTLDQAKGLFDARDYKTELETSIIDTYGFYIKRDHLYLLWVGIWNKALAPLTFGFHSKKPGWLRPKEIPPLSSDANDHNLWSLPSETWDDPEKLYAQVHLFLQSYLIDLN